MEIIRKILFAIQAKEGFEPKQIELDEGDSSVVARHIELLYRAGFLDGTMTGTVSRGCYLVFVRDLSWEGHEFLSNISKAEVWEKLRNALGPDGLSTLSWDVLKEAAKAAASEWVKKRVISA
jgi:hypothetical protein